MAKSATIIGGGISGLVAAYELHKAGWEVSIHEAASYWGGKILSTPVGDRLVDAGPDTFLARSEATVTLCRELGLEDELVSPSSTVPAYIYRSGKLYRFPKGAILGVPTDLEALQDSGLLSDQAIREATEEPTLAATPTSPNMSVGQLCRLRLGDELTDYLIDPLIGGINASSVDNLCAQSSTPLFSNALSKSTSLIEGMRQTKPNSSLGNATNKPIFFGLPKGISSITDALVKKIPSASLHLNSPVPSLDSLPTKSDTLIIATPAYSAASLLSEKNPDAATLLGQISYASVAQVTVEMEAKDVDPVLDTSGIVFPKAEGLLLSACTWLSSKWDHYKSPSRTVLLRLTTGRWGQDQHTKEMSDEQLTTALLLDLGKAITLKGNPQTVRVHRWPQSFPQYTPGHGQRIEQIAEALQQTPGVYLAGAAYTGIGIPACVQSGQRAAQAALTQVKES